MKPNKEMAKRLRSILTRDKIGIKEGFSTALNNDLNRLLKDYFDITENCELKIEQAENGEYSLSFYATASHIKQFDTTADIKRF